MPEGCLVECHRYIGIRVECHSGSPTLCSSRITYCHSECAARAAKRPKRSPSLHSLAPSPSTTSRHSPSPLHPTHTHRYFKHNRMAFFVKQLRAYGFKQRFGHSCLDSAKEWYARERSHSQPQPKPQPKPKPKPKRKPTPSRTAPSLPLHPPHTTLTSLPPPHHTHHSLAGSTSMATSAAACRIPSSSSRGPPPPRHRRRWHT